MGLSAICLGTKVSFKGVRCRAGKAGVTGGIEEEVEEEVEVDAVDIVGGAGAKTEGGGGGADEGAGFCAGLFSFLIV